MGLRWWNEVNTATGDSHWVFETSEGTGRVINATDKRFFWLSMYVAPVLWVALGVLALVRMIGVIWLVIVGELLHSPCSVTEKSCGETPWSRQSVLCRSRLSTANDLLVLTWCVLFA